MKRVKKKLAALLAAATMLSGVSLLPASATSYDVNNDGSVNSSDSLFLYKYLIGLQDVTDVSKLDVNGNHIVDTIDLECLNTVIYGGSISVDSLDEPDSVNDYFDHTNTYYYRKHSCSSTNDASYTSYSLTQDVMNNGLDSSISWPSGDISEPDSITTLPNNSEVDVVVMPSA